MVLVQKWSLFQLFFLANRPGKCLLPYCKTTKGLSRLYKQQDQKVEKIDTFPKGLTHGSGPSMTNFFDLFLLDNIGQENFFYIILKRKKAFLGYKNKKFKEPKKLTFFKRG